jgi:hypothetical protein
MKRLGPDLKMPDLKNLKNLKVPGFLGDLLFDLRDRRLLAPIALVLVAIVAVPFLLSGGSEKSTVPPPAGSATVPTEASEAATLTVVEAKPGLRDYRKRLRARQPTNPFKQRFTGPRVNGSEFKEANSPASTVTTVTTTSSGESSVSGETTTGPPSPEPTPPTPSPGASPGSSGGAEPQLTYFSWAINVWISKAGGNEADPKAGAESNVKHRVLVQTPLPGPKAPVVTYLGLSRKAAQKENARKALLLVSNDVSSVSGEAKCVSAGEVCQLLEAEPGIPITFVYGANETRYTIKVLKIELVVTGHN